MSTGGHLCNGRKLINECRTNQSLTANTQGSCCHTVTALWQQWAPSPAGMNNAWIQLTEVEAAAAICMHVWLAGCRINASWQEFSSFPVQLLLGIFPAGIEVCNQPDGYTNTSLQSLPDSRHCLTALTHSTDSIMALTRNENCLTFQQHFTCKVTSKQTRGQFLQNLPMDQTCGSHSDLITQGWTWDLMIKFVRSLACQESGLYCTLYACTSIQSSGPSPV